MAHVLSGVLMKRFIEGEGRQQVALLPECLDGYIGEHNPVRVVDFFVDELDLQALASEEQIQPLPAGRRTTWRCFSSSTSTGT